MLFGAVHEDQHCHKHTNQTQKRNVVNTHARVFKLNNVDYHIDNYCTVLDESTHGRSLIIPNMFADSSFYVCCCCLGAKPDFVDARP